MPLITAAFDSGNIEVVSADDPSDIRLRIRSDSEADFRQWFHFRLSGARGVACQMTIENAGDCSYTRGWEGYSAVVSEDRLNWVRTETEYTAGKLVIHYQPASDHAYFGYFAPYSLERHADLVAGCLGHPRCSLEVPGRTVQGRDIDLLTIGEPGEGKPNLWLIARQHPGESMAEWFMEGFLERLLDGEDGVSRAVLNRAAVYAVPNMNPDGSYLGNLRVNAAGANLNREWADPSEEKSPEVFHVRRRMQEEGIDLCLDVHGDEGLPYNFIAGFEGVPEPGEARLAALERFKTTLARINPDFQTEHGYPKAPAGKGNLTTSTGHLAHALGAMSMTLEMPFKDAANAPDPELGWSPGRAMALGRSTVDALLDITEALGK